MKQKGRFNQNFCQKPSVFAMAVALGLLLALPPAAEADTSAPAELSTEPLVDPAAQKIKRLDQQTLSMQVNR